MSVYPRQPNRQAHSEGDWGPVADHAEEPERKGCAGYLLFGLLLLAVIVLCATGFFLARVFLRGSSPATLPALIAGTPLFSTPSPGQETSNPANPSAPALLAIDPQQGYINTLVTASGQGWWPGEPVFVFLRSQAEADGGGYAYAAAVADDRGNIQTAFTFPNELRWLGEEWAEVIARGSRSGLEASTRFTLVAPTPTNTVPPPTFAPTRTPTNTPPPTDTPWPTDTPLPTSTPTSEVIITDWLGEYFANSALAGDPVLIRNDVAIDFNWGAGSPGPGVPADQFSARWTRLQSFSEGPYRFVVTADDGVRFWIDGQLLVDEWHDATMTDYVVNLSLSQGQHALQINYYENLGGAMIKLQWSPIQPSTPTPTPTDTPPPAPRPLPDNWQAEYYDNPLLGGRPALTRVDPEINFDWGNGSPAEVIPSDNFSARWMGQKWVPAGTYRYSITADDWVRLWIDGEKVIDAWPSLPGQEHTVDVLLEEDTHTFLVEFAEGFGQAYIWLRGEAVANE